MKSALRTHVLRQNEIAMKNHLAARRALSRGYIGSESPAVTYSHGALHVTVPYHGLRSGSGRLILEVLDPENGIVGRSERLVETGNDSWRFKSRDDDHATRARLVSAIPASSDETSATTKPRRSKGSKLEADEGSNLNAD